MGSTFRILGPLEVSARGTSVALGGPKQRAVLALLLVDHGHVASVDGLMDALWGEDVNAGSKNLVQVYVSNLRRALDPVAAALGIEAVIKTLRPGYVLDVPAAEVDAAEFDRLRSEARAKAMAGQSDVAVQRLTNALALWRGSALADVAAEPGLAGAITRLEAARLTAAADRLELLLGLDSSPDVVEEAAALLSAHPLDERVRGLLMLALYRRGRQADALAVFREGRRLLAEELGLDPCPALRDLEVMILRQAPELTPPRTPVAGGPSLTVPASSILAPRGQLIVGERVIPLERDVTTIGRRPDRMVVLHDERTSRCHAEVRRQGQGFVVVDTASLNGVRVNGLRICEPTVLSHGDEIVIGATELRFAQT